MLAFVLHIFLETTPASLINLLKGYGFDSFQIHLGESLPPVLTLYESLGRGWGGSVIETIFQGSNHSR